MAVWHPKLEAARWRLLRGGRPGDPLARPYLAAGLYALQPAGHRDGCPTAAVDQYWRLYWNDRWIDSLDVEVLAAVLYHELLHVLRKHHVRLRNYPQMLANVAADLEINDDLIHEGFRLPGGGVWPEKLGLPDRHLAEEYVRMLREEWSPPVANGSGANGRQQDWEDPAPARGGPPGLGEREADLVRRRVAEAVRGAARGTVPAHLNRWADDVLGPAEVPWCQLLASYVRSAVCRRSGVEDFSYRRIRRSRGAVADGDVVLPAPDSPQPEVAVVVDTSGSMSPAQLVACLRELRGIIAAVGTHVTVLPTDSAVQAVCRVQRTEDLRAWLTGGGGTSMTVGIEAAVKLRPRPDVVVVITDGLTDWPPTAPAVPVVVAIVGGSRRTEVPGWAKVVYVA